MPRKIPERILRTTYAMRETGRMMRVSWLGIAVSLKGAVCVDMTSLPSTARRKFELIDAFLRFRSILL